MKYLRGMTWALAAAMAASASGAETLGGGMSVSLSLPAAGLTTAMAPPAAGIPATPAPAAMPPVPAQPSAIPAAAKGPRFDLSVNNAPASQVFLQLGAGTAYNMLVSPDIAGNITVSLKNTTVPEALEALRELFGYDFRITGNRVFVYPNTVQTRLFRINYLPGRRQGASDLRVSSSSITATGGTSGSGTSGSTGSSSSGSSATAGTVVDTAHVRMTSDADFWKEVQLSLVSLVGQAEGRSVVLNPAAGVIVVRASPAELRQVEGYLRAIQLTIERQVMLEAKIIEVQLRRESQTGVNWSVFRNVTNGSAIGQFSGGAVAPGITLNNTGVISNSDATINAGKSVVTDVLGRGFYGLTFQSEGFAALISFLETQGDVQVLSSPRIATLNNQKAVLKVGSDELFVTGVTSNQTTNGNTTTNTPTLTLQPFFSGISLDVTPQIDDQGNVMLHVHPAISAVSEKQKIIDLGELGSYRLPLAASAINETDSIVRVKDGHIVAIGGLMQHEAALSRNGIPGLSDVPAVGGLFRQKTTASAKRELVILIKPTVIAQDGTGWSADEVATPMLPAKPREQ